MTVFARLLEVIAENLPGTLEDVDTEFLHDLRVAVRRTRSLQRQFKTVYPERLQHFRDEFKRIQQVTGDLRDLDVYLLDFDDLRDVAAGARCAPTSTRCAACSSTAARRR